MNAPPGVLIACGLWVKAYPTSPSRRVLPRLKAPRSPRRAPVLSSTLSEGSTAQGSGRTGAKPRPPQEPGRRPSLPSRSTSDTASVIVVGWWQVSPASLWSATGAPAKAN